MSVHSLAIEYPNNTGIETAYLLRPLPEVEEPLAYDHHYLHQGMLHTRSVIDPHLITRLYH